MAYPPRSGEGRREQVRRVSIGSVRALRDARHRAWVPGPARRRIARSAGRERGGAQGCRPERQVVKKVVLVYSSSFSE